MGNISYFCIVKRFKYIFRYTTLFIFLLLTDVVYAQVPESILQQMDSVDICLLTCQPGSKIYNIYGHTAIRYHDKSRNQDLTINYGMFSFGKPYFILRFVFGLTDYEMGIEPFDEFCAQYASENRGVVQQTLNLSAQEKLAIAQAIDDNYKPENRVYRYNYLYDNCTTRARNILINHINGTIKYTNTTPKETSYRELIHQMNDNYPWSKFGNDVLLGVKADFKTNRFQQQFLPDILRKDFATALIIGKDGNRKKLIAKTQVIIPQGVQTKECEFPLRPMTCALILLALTIIITCIEFKNKCHIWGYDVTLILITGLAGIILTAMIFSQHPTVSLNLQILLLNPLPLFIVLPIIRATRNRQVHWYIKASTILIILFFIGNILQNYAEGMNIVALSLLIRYISIIGNRKK